MSTTNIVYLCLGSNVGDRRGLLTTGLEELERRGVSIAQRSSVYETEPVGLEGQPWFLNQVVGARTKLAPRALLDVCKEIERWLGRRLTGVRFGPRPLDIDILLYGDEVVEESRLTIPHPRMNERRFVLVPLVEIAPNLADPRTGSSYAKVLSRLDEGKKVQKSLPSKS